MNIEFGKYDFRIERRDEIPFVFDVIRKKFVALTPEESVRQHWIHYLIHEAKYPRSLIAVEMKIIYNQLTKRCDLVVHEKSGKPFLIVECKSPDVRLTQKVFDQVARYNLTLRVKYLVVSNGSKHYGCEINFSERNYSMLRELPAME